MCCILIYKLRKDLNLKKRVGAENSEMKENKI